MFEEEEEVGPTVTEEDYGIRKIPSCQAKARLSSLLVRLRFFRLR